MKKFLALLFAVLCLFSVTACREVEEKEELPYDLSQSGVDNKNNTVVSYDRAKAFYNQYKSLVNQYGAADFDGTNLKGVAVVRLYDFLGNGQLNMYVAYADGTKPYVNKQAVYGFDNGMSKMLERDNSYVKQDITSKATADADAYSIWLYKNSTGRGYIVTGEDMSKSADYSTYIALKDGEKFYAFNCEFTKTDNETLSGTYEKIKVSGLTEADAEKIFAENKKVIDSMKTQSQMDTVR